MVTRDCATPKPEIYRRGLKMPVKERRAMEAEQTADRQEIAVKIIIE